MCKNTVNLRPVCMRAFASIIQTISDCVNWHTASIQLKAQKDKTKKNHSEFHQ